MAAEIDRDELLFDGPANAQRTLVLAHGAGAAMDSRWMETIAHGVAAGGVRVVRFEFPYMAERRRSGAKKPPNSAKILEAHWLAVVELLGDRQQTFVGGKSMGGRIASQVADRAGVAGVVCMGYPFHPPGRPTTLRTAHLREMQTPTLIVQGERDTFGNREDVSGYELSENIRVEWLPDGDHSLKPRVRSGHTEEENMKAAIALVAAFVRDA